MSAFDLETAARALMPKEIFAQASSSHLAMHVANAYVLVGVTDVASEKPLWTQIFPVQDDSMLASGFQFIEARNWFDRVFRKVTLSFESQYFTLIPEVFFDAAQMESVMRFNHPQFDGQVNQLELREADSRVLFEWPSAMEGLIRRAPHTRVMPLAFLMARFAHHPQWNEAQQINVLVSGSHLMITAMQNQRLLLLNSFEVSNETDVLYHLSNLAIRLEFDLEKVPIMVLKGADAMSLDVLDTYCGAIKKAPFAEVVHPIFQLHSICA
jgi:hypothetical protein